MHVPHYTSMFSRLLRGPRPWRYGSLYLPEGSRNLGNEEYALEPGTKVRPAPPAADAAAVLLLLAAHSVRGAPESGMAAAWQSGAAAWRGRGCGWTSWISQLGRRLPCRAACAQAPLAGTLMEVLQAVRFVDGRVLILVRAAARLGQIWGGWVLRQAPWDASGESQRWTGQARARLGRWR